VITQAVYTWGGLGPGAEVGRGVFCFSAMETPRAAFARLTDMANPEARKADASLRDKWGDWVSTIT